MSPAESVRGRRRWSRPSGRLPLAVVAVGAVLVQIALAVAAPSAAAAGADDPPRRARKVVVVAAPRLTWDVVRDLRPPNLTRFFADAAVAATSPRTVGSRTDPSRAYLTIGAGNRAAVADPLTAGQSADRDELVPGGTAAQVFERRTGTAPTGAVLGLTFVEQARRNEELNYGSAPGATGEALRRAGRRVAVVGNADLGPQDANGRTVALAALDGGGQAPAGTVSDRLLRRDPLAPFGVRLDPSVAAGAARAAVATADHVVVELSDLERAEAARPQSSVAQGDALFAEALRAGDRLFGEVLRAVDLDRDVVMVLGPTAPSGREELTVFGVAGPGFRPGWARSATTRRNGYVTLTDVASTALRALGVAPPPEVNDTPVSSVAAPAGRTALADRVDAMVRTNERAVFRDGATGPVTVSFIVLLVLLLVSVAVALSRNRSGGRSLQWSALTVFAVPVAAYLSGVLPYGPMNVATLGLAVLVLAGLLAAAALALLRVDVLAPPLALAAATVTVLVLDIALGAALQINTLFGYSPIVAGRFAGFGNQAFSVLSLSTLVAVTAGWELWFRRHPASGRRGPALVAGAAMVGVVVADGAPQLGSDVGGVLASAPAFAVCLLMLLGVRLRARLVALIAVGTVAVISAFAALDMSRAPESRTHLGRFASKVLDGGAGTILERKVQANLSVLTSTVWTVVIPAALLFFAYLTWRPNRFMSRIVAAHPSFRPFGTSALVLGVLAWALNDSGVSMPAMMLTMALPYTAWLALDRVDDA